MEIILNSGAIIAIVMGLTEVAKRMGLGKRYLPLLSVIVGALMSALITGITTTSIVFGIVYGLMACGIWSGAKATIKG